MELRVVAMMMMNDVVGRDKHQWTVRFQAHPRPSQPQTQYDRKDNLRRICIRVFCQQTAGGTLVQAERVVAVVPYRRNGWWFISGL